MDANLLSLFWEGFELESYEVSTANTVLLRLKPRPSHVPRCGSCGQTVQRVHDVNRRRVRSATCSTIGCGWMCPCVACAALSVVFGANRSAGSPDAAGLLRP